MIPKGSTIFIPFCTIFRSPNYFEEPDKFMPERFSKEQTKLKNSPFTYSPFSAGPRNCVAQKYAMYEMKCLILKMLWNFEISLAKENEVEPILCAEIILRPEKAIKFNLKRRH